MLAGTIGDHLDLRDDDVVPVRKSSLDRQLQRLGHWHLFLWRLVLVPFVQIGVNLFMFSIILPLILGNVGVVRMILSHVRRGDIKRSPPNLDLNIFFTFAFFLGRIDHAWENCLQNIWVLSSLWLGPGPLHWLFVKSDIRIKLVGLWHSLVETCASPCFSAVSALLRPVSPP